MNAPCLIYKLSDELLSAIVEALIIEPKAAIPNLKALRLSSSRFAHLYPIPKFLFANIRLVADAEHLHRLPQADLGRNLSLVRKVTFVAPSIFSKVQLGLESVRSDWYIPRKGEGMPSIDDAVIVGRPEDGTINLDNFKTTLLHQPLRRLAKYPWIQTWQRFCPYLSSPAEMFSRQQLRLEAPDPQLDGLIRNEFGKNHEDAQDARDLLLGDDIIAAWTNVLRALPHVHTWRVATVSKEVHFPMSYDHELYDMVRPEDHGSKYQCHTYDEELGDALFAATIRSLSEANTRIHELIVDCVMTGHFGWKTLPGWQGLDLSHLQKFHFQPIVNANNDDFNEVEWDGNIAPRAADAIAAVLEECKDSLQEFTCKRVCPLQYPCPLQWPGSEIINLPELRSLVLDLCHIRPRNLGKWMARMPLLQHLSIYGGNICEDFHSDFRSVLDAVRNQSKGMRVRLGLFWTKAHIEFDYHTYDVELYSGEKESDKQSEDVSRNLRLYLSGKVDWNPSWLDLD